MLLIVVTAVLCVHTAVSLPVGSIVYPDTPVDLSYALDGNNVFWPNIQSSNLSFMLQTIFDGRRPDGVYYRSKWYKSAEHGGTHIDAPSHFSENGVDISQVSLAQLTGRMVLLDVSQKVLNNPDYQVDLTDVADWEARCGQITSGSFVVMFSNWGTRWPDPSRVFSTCTPTNESTLHFPAFHPDTVQLLVSRYQIKGVGVDTPSTDYGQSTDFKVHQVLAGNGLVGLENVANLDKMGTSCFMKIAAYPTKIVGGSGAPVRLAGWAGQRGYQ